MTDETRIVKIDFNNEHHRNIILKLCEINDNYHYGDIFGVINLNRFKNNEVREEELKDTLIKNYGNDIFVKILKMKGGDIINSIKEYMLKRFENMSWFGEFILEGKKVVGFIINSINKITELLFIEFILIDKKYKNKGYGSKLVKNIQELSKKIKGYVSTQPDNLNTREWFKKKLNFKEYTDYSEVLVVTNKEDREKKIYYFDKECYEKKLEDLNGDNEAAKREKMFIKMINDLREKDPEKADMLLNLTSDLMERMKRR
jgi:ribosomal protein S18 acetylase RimI-like enzyme